MVRRGQIAPGLCFELFYPQFSFPNQERVKFHLVEWYPETGRERVVCVCVIRVVRAVWHRAPCVMGTHIGGLVMTPECGVCRRNRCLCSTLVPRRREGQYMELSVALGMACH